MLMSIDDARACMEDNGREAIAAVCAAADEVRRALPALGYGDAHAMWQNTGLQFDPTRLVIDAPQGGAALAAAFREKGVDVEMFDLRRVVFILSPMDTPDEVLHILSILKEIPLEKVEIPQLPMLTGIPERAMEVRAAAMAETEYVPLAECEGRIATASAGLYPPGVPLVCPGEVVSREVLQRLMHAKQQERFGVEGDTLICVKL
jgi:arginine/lysine/ornithine decarboxylase